jgi:hypothetical protein
MFTNSYDYTITVKFLSQQTTISRLLAYQQGKGQHAEA